MLQLRQGSNGLTLRADSSDWVTCGGVFTTVAKFTALHAPRVLLTHCRRTEWGKR